MNVQAVTTINLGQKLGQLRSVPVRLGDEQAMLLIYAADLEIDPSPGMFFYPTDTLKMMLVTLGGEVIWRRDLGRGVVPGVWFCPVLPFDLDGDGVDDIWYVGNDNVQHPLDWRDHHLVRLDARTGNLLGQNDWHGDLAEHRPMYQGYRNFILGAHVRGEPLLITAQGTYSDMYLQAWGPGMQSRWQRTIIRDDPGARGSHMTPIIDINDDGVDELFWGERCIELATGTDLFCADRDQYRGHSDVVHPFYADTCWRFFTCRENDPDAAPRVVTYDERGDRVWGDIETGHIDQGWVAWLGDTPTAMAIRIGGKRRGPDGLFHDVIERFAYDAITGARIELPFDPYRAIPVDINGDGFHELIYQHNGTVIDQHGTTIGDVGGQVAQVSHFLDHPGEHIVSFQADGTVQFWADVDAEDSPRALARYQHPAYLTNQRLSAVGYNLTLLTGF